MSERIQKPHLPYRQEVESVVGGVLKRCHPLGTLATIYYKEAPNLIAKTVDGNTPAHLNRLFRTSHFSDETFRGILEAMAQWSNFDAQVAESLVAETVPCLMACTSFLKLENVKSSMNIGWQLLAKQVGEGKVSLMSPLCPPYDYVVTSNGHLKHATGSLQPKIGERFETVAKTLGRAFKPLTIKGVEVTWEFWTYSGETLNLDDVVDLGADVIQHYQRPEEIFSNLQAAYRDLRYQATHHMSEFGVVAKTVSIENVIGPVIHQTTEEFMTSFPKSRNGIHPPEEPEIDKWLDDRFGVKAGWLIFFIQDLISIFNHSSELIQPKSFAGLAHPAM